MGLNGNAGQVQCTLFAMGVGVPSQQGKSCDSTDQGKNERGHFNFLKKKPNTKSMGGTMIESPISKTFSGLCWVASTTAPTMAVTAKLSQALAKPSRCSLFNSLGGWYTRNFVRLWQKVAGHPKWSRYRFSSRINSLPCYLHTNHALLPALLQAKLLACVLANRKRPSSSDRSFGSVLR